MGNRYATTESGHFVEIIAMRTEDDGSDWCLVIKHETGTEWWAEADTLTPIN